MKKSLLFALLLFLAIPAISKAQDALDGTWKVDLSKAQMPKSLTYTCCRMACTTARPVSPRLT